MKKGSLLVLFLTVFVDLLGFGIVVPLLPYYAQAHGASGMVLGLVLGSYSLMQFFFSPVWGRLSDRIGRRPVLIGSLLGNVTGYLIFAVAHSVPLLLLSRVVSGIAAANIGTAQAYVADTTSVENRSKGMGLIGAAFGLGFIFGPPTGGLLSHLGESHHLSGNMLPGILAAMLSLTAMLVAFFSLPESKPPGLVPRSSRPPQFDREIWHDVFADRRISLAIAALFLTILSFSGMEPSVVLHGRDRFHFTARDLGYFFGFMGVIVALIQGGVIGRITRRFGDAGTAVIGMSSLLIALALIPSIYTVPYLYAVAVLIAISQGFCYPALTSHLSKMAPEAHRGSILGISQSLGSLGRVIGPILAGLLYDRYQGAGAFYGQAVVVAVGAVCALSLRGLMRSADLVGDAPATGAEGSS